MKRLTIIFSLFFLLLFLLPSQADDALVFPKGVMRLIYYNTSLDATEFFDEDGEIVDAGEYLGIPDVDTDPIMSLIYANGGYLHEPQAHLRIVRSDFIFDIGITDKISARLWFPYYFQKKTKVTYYPPFNDEEYFWFDLLAGVTLPPNLLMDSNASGLGDMLIGFKHQIIGSNDIERGLRFCYSTGFRLPTAKIWDPVSDPNGSQLDDGQMDIGIWTHTDLVLTKNFYVNLFTKYEMQMQGTHKLDLGVGKGVEVDYAPGNFVYAEFEPHYKIPLKEKTNMELLLAITYEKEEAGTYTLPEEYGGTEIDLEDDYELMTIAPCISIESWDTSKVPFEFEARYAIPYSGKKYPVFTRLQFVLKIYTKIF